MRIDIHSHLMSVPFLEHLRGRDALPTAARDGTGYITHCAPGLSLPYRAPILSVEAKLAEMDAAGIDLAVLSHGLPGPHVLGGAERIGLWDHAIPSLPGQPQPARPAGGCLDRLYVDTVGYGPAPLEYCYAQLGAGRMLFGTDHPYATPSLAQDLAERLPCTQAEREQILAGNARRLLRLGATVAGRA